MANSGEYTVEYEFTADVKGLEKGVEEVKQTLDDAKKDAQDFGSGVSQGATEAAESVEELNLKVTALAVAVGTLTTAFAVDSLGKFKDYESAMYGMASAVGNVGGTISQAMEGIRETTASGLLSETDAATAIRNLTLYGYSVSEATDMIRAMTNASIANLKAGETVDEKVIKMTEAVKNHSDAMLRRNGILSAGTQANEEYAQSIGKTADDLTKAEEDQARYNAIMEAGQESTAIANQYQETYAAATQRLANNMENLKVAFGQILAPVASFVADMAAWVVENKQVVAGILTFISVLVGGYSVYKGITLVVGAVKTLVAWFAGLSVAGKGVAGVLTAIVSVAAIAATVSAVNSMKTGLEGLSGAARDAAEGVDDYTQSVSGGGNGGAVGATKQLSDTLARLRRDYLEDLKSIEIKHQETINKLTKQIQDANVDYKRAIDERNAEFAVSQAKEEKKHQEKVDELMTQIEFLRKYNNDYNKQKLSDLEFALAKENAAYQKQTQAAKEELDLQNENDRIAYEEKRKQFQAELDDELAFMEKHRADLNEVRDLILLDEIDSLKRRYEEQKKSYAEQAVAAKIAGGEVAGGYTDGVSDYFDENSVKFFDMGSVLGIDWSKGIVNGIQEGIRKIGDFLNNLVIYTDEQGHQVTLGNISSVFSGVGRYFDWLIPTKGVQKLAQKIIDAFSGGSASRGSSEGGWASGGYTGQGGVNEVAGIVHRGEYVLPQEMVDQTTGTPKAMGNTYVINVNGTFATSAAERRRVADQIVQAINQNNKSRLEASWQ